MCSQRCYDDYVIDGDHDNDDNDRGDNDYGDDDDDDDDEPLNSFCSGDGDGRHLEQLLDLTCVPNRHKVFHHLLNL